MSEIDHIAQIRDEWGALRPAFLVDLLTALDADDAKLVRTLTRELHAADMADVLQAVEQSRRVQLIAVLGKNFDVEALAELDEGTRDAILKDRKSTRLNSSHG